MKPTKTTEKSSVDKLDYPRHLNRKLGQSAVSPQRCQLRVDHYGSGSWCVASFVLANVKDSYSKQVLSLSKIHYMQHIHAMPFSSHLPREELVAKLIVKFGLDREDVASVSV